MNIKLIIHTGADISLEEAKELNATMIYDIVSFTDKSYKNILEITPNDFYKKLKESKELPTSSHASVGEFYRVFKNELEDGSIILFLCVTSEMSGTYETALTAKKMLENEGKTKRIFIYDTLECSIGMAKLVRKARELIDSNLSIDDILDSLENYRKRIRLYFLLDSLKYASKGGRVGKIKSKLADGLNIKPILSFDDGYVRDIGISKGFEDGLQTIIDMYNLNADKTDEIVIFHSDNLEKAINLKNELLRMDNNINVRIDEVGPVIGIYAGPGAVGISFINK